MLDVVVGLTVQILVRVSGFPVDGDFSGSIIFLYAPECPERVFGLLVAALW